MSTLALAFFASLTVSLLLTPATRAVARRVGAVDRPDGKRKLQVQPVALGGGIAVYLAFGFALLLAGLMRPAGETVPARLTVVLALSTGLLGLVGLLDDTLDLRPRRKLLLQFLAAAPVVLAGFFPTQITFFGYVWSAGWWACARRTVMARCLCECGEPTRRARRIRVDGWNRTCCDGRRPGGRLRKLGGRGRRSCPFGSARRISAV